MTPLRQPRLAALQLSGKSARPPQSYVRAVRLLAQFYHTLPDLISEQHWQPSLLHRKNVERLSPSSMRICDSAIRFFYPQVLGRDWQTVEIMRAEPAQRLPAVLSRPEVQRLLQAMPPVHQRAYFTTRSRCGLRRNEALYLPGGDIDGPRHMRHGHRGKGAQDRSIPLPDDTLTL
jgi:integrase/recombinase XerD